MSTAWSPDNVPPPGRQLNGAMNDFNDCPLEPEPVQCPRCGAVLDTRRFDGLCPACTWDSIAGAAFREPGTAQKPRLASGLLELPGYLVLEEIARGGMGIVYRARQFEPEREVALKMLLPHQLGSAEVRERFRTETRAIAALDHPAILPVYEVGECDETPFFTMKLAAGGSLAGRLGHYPRKYRDCALLLVQVAEAVQFAHEHGVLHRDLKPGNVLFDSAGRPYVSDFGLAKLAGSDSELTRSVEVLGTPQYLAPEVAASSARQATTSSDQYSLGAILYELLAGQPPFQAEGLPALLRKIAEQDPPAFPATVPRDLAVICLKCLAKLPAQRYESVGELARDLRRWLEGKPIAARPLSPAGKVWRWAKRNPWLAATSTALALALLGGSSALLRSYHQVRSALVKADRARAEAQFNLAEALLSQSRALGAAKSTGQRYVALQALARAAKIRPSLELRNEAAAALARPDLREVARFGASFGPAGTPVVFCSDLHRYIAPEPSGGFCLRAADDQRVLRAFPGTLGKPARWFVLSPDDQRVAALLDDYSLELWDLDSGTPLQRWPPNYREPPVADFHPDGHTLAGFISGQGCFLQNLDGSQRRVLFSTAPRALYLRFDATGQRLAVVRDGGAGIELWRCDETPELLWSIPLASAVPWLSWSPDQQRLAVAANDGRGLRLLWAKDGQTELSYSRHLRYPRQFEFAPHGNEIASLGDDWFLRIWDGLTGQDLLTGIGRHRVMRFSNDGRRLTTAPGENQLALLELAPKNVFRDFSVAWSGPLILCSGFQTIAQGRLLLTLYPELRVYDPSQANEVAVYRKPTPLPISAPQLSSHHDTIFYSRKGEGIYRAKILTNEPSEASGLAADFGPAELIVKNPQAALLQVAVESGDWVVKNGDSFEFWRQGDPSRTIKLGFTPSSSVISLSPDGRWLAAIDDSTDALTICDVVEGCKLISLPVKRPGSAWFSPDNQWLIASCDSGYLTWRCADWKPGPKWEAKLDLGDPGEIAFSADRTLLAARQEREIFKVMRFPDFQEVITLAPPMLLPVRNACFSADGSKLWLLANGYRVFEWNLAALHTELAALSLDWTQPPRKN